MLSRLSTLLYIHSLLLNDPFAFQLMLIKLHIKYFFAKRWTFRHILKLNLSFLIKAHVSNFCVMSDSNYKFKSYLIVAYWIFIPKNEKGYNLWHLIPNTFGKCVYKDLKLMT